MATLPDSDQQKWLYEPHTRVKHRLLERYVAAWGRIMGSEKIWRGPQRLVLVDGFAGRGEHYDERTRAPVPESGSPVIMLRTAHELVHTGKAKEVVCAFIEQDEQNHTRLAEVVDSYRERYKDATILAPYFGTFASVIDQVVQESGAHRGPAFFFIDPFGYSDAPMLLMRKLLSSNRQTELFINYMARDESRFFGAKNRDGTYERLHGEAIENLPDDPRERRRHYIDSLSGGCTQSFPTEFKVCSDDRRETLYYLIHFCQHPRGRRLMKRVMFNASAADTGAEFAYLGPDDYVRYQGRLFVDDNSAILADLLSNRFGGRTLTFAAVQDETCMDTLLVERHYREAIRMLEARERAQVIRIESKKTGIGEKDRVRFLST